MQADPLLELEASYDRVAVEYSKRIYDELSHKPFDRELLDRFADRVRAGGVVCDVGCGPGHVARYLLGCGLHVCGLDLSTRMVEIARTLNPGIDFRQGNLLSMSVADDTWAGITAFYSIIHVPRIELSAAFREMQRVLRPGGWLLVAFHVGTDSVHLDEWWGHPVSLDAIFFKTEEILRFLKQAGFEEGEAVERDPYPAIEYQSRRGYIFARKPTP